MTSVFEECAGEREWIRIRPNPTKIKIKVRIGGVRSKLYSPANFCNFAVEKN